MTQRNDPARRGMDRRRLLLAGAGALGVGGAGGAAWVATRDPRQFVIALVRNALPGVTIDPESADVFARDFMEEFYARFRAGEEAGRILSGAKIRAAEAARGVLGTGAFGQGGAFEDAAAEIVRRAVTRFLMNSNFFQLADPSSEPVVYVSPVSQACRSPFADLRPPSPEDVVPWRT